MGCCARACVGLAGDDAGSAAKALTGDDAARWLADKRGAEEARGVAEQEADEDSSTSSAASGGAGRRRPWGGAISLLGRGAGGIGDLIGTVLAVRTGKLRGGPKVSVKGPQCHVNGLP